MVLHSRQLFTVMPYDKVSTRMIAEKAGVNIAMIRYYFGSKEGLFETMLRETLAPMKKMMNALIEDGGQDNLFGLMRTYYREMNNVPEFPRLVIQVMHFAPSNTQRSLLEKVMADVMKPTEDKMFQSLQRQGLIREDADPKLCKISFLSLMVFPFIAPPALLNMHGIEINEEFLSQLLEHNIQMMAHGFLTAGALSNDSE
nr:TetR/AcrR family transcriptional regulator [Vibrio gelatinilyticus]